MVQRVVEKVGEGFGMALSIVDTGEEGVLEKELATGMLDVVAGSGHQLGDRVARGDGHDLFALFLERGVQGDRQMELLRLVGEAPDLFHQPAGRDGDVPRRQRR